MYSELDAYPPVLTIQEVADLLRVSHESVRRRVVKGDIQHVRFGAKRLIPREVVRSLLTPTTA